MRTIYVVNYRDEKRRQNMIRRLNAVLPGASVHFSPGLSGDDTLLDDARSANQPARTWATMLDHLANIRHFYESGDKYALFCEDDLIVYRDLGNLLPMVYDDAANTGLDLVLLSALYLQAPGLSKVLPDSASSHLGTHGHQYYQYDDEMWGAHMYILSRPYAHDLLQTYTLEWALANTHRPYCSDWIITKVAFHRAAIFPPLGVEEGDVKTDDLGQIQFHRASHEFIYELYSQEMWV
jgi:hypothetical protein